MRRVSARLVPLAFLIYSGCGLIGGPEGTYMIDRARTKANIEPQAMQAIAQLSGEEKAMQKKMHEEFGIIIDQLSMELHLERGGKFRGQSKLGEISEHFEGTWTLHGDKLEMKTVSKDGKQLSSPKVEVLHYEDWRLSYRDASMPFPFLVLSKQ